MRDTTTKAGNIKGLTKRNKTKDLPAKDFNMRKWDGFDDDINRLQDMTFATSGAQAIKIAVKEKLAQV